MDSICKNKQRTQLYTQIHSSADRPLASPAAMPCGKTSHAFTLATPRGPERWYLYTRPCVQRSCPKKKGMLPVPPRSFPKRVVIHTGSVMSGVQVAFACLPGAHSSSRCPLESGVSSPRPIRAGRPHPRRRRCCRPRRTMPPIAGRDCRGSLGGIVRPWLPWGRTDGQASVHPGR